MQGSESRLLSIYHVGFYVCLVLAILFLLLSILMFFKFKIPQIYDLRTGRGAKKTVQKMQEINDATGRLRQIYEPASNSSRLRRQPGARKVDVPVVETPATPVKLPDAPPQEENATVPLSQDNLQTPVKPINTTGSEEPPFVTVMGSENRIFNPVNLMKNGSGRFLIDTNIILIHTNEVID